MTYIRYMFDLAFEEPINSALQGQLIALEAMAHSLKYKAKKITLPSGLVEDTTRATKHICHHDTGELCENEEEI